MTFDIDKYVSLAGPLKYDDIDFSEFERNPLPADALRALKYMHDVEYHTICYLRDLLLTRAHKDATATTFLTFWQFEEFFHGEALAKVLKSHGELAGADRVQKLRNGLGAKDRIGPLKSMIGSALFKDFGALHMAWGAVNEYSTQAGYVQLIRHTQHPTLTLLLKRIMKQEGRHIDYYATTAKDKLEASPKARRVTRWALAHLWAPVGSGVMPNSERDFMIRYLFDDEEGHKAIERIDRQVDRIPGLEGLGLFAKSLKAIK